MNIRIFLFLSILLSSLAFAGDGKTHMSLTEQLVQRARASAKKIPANKKAIMDQALENLRQTRLLQTAKKVGDRAPDFKLTDFQKGSVRLKKLLGDGPVVVVFYRGGWCPYCNLQLRDLQLHKNAIEGLGATLVAISPELPDRTVETAKKQKLGFYVLSDRDGKVGKSFGLIYQIPQKLNDLYKEFGIDLDKSNGNNRRELPIAATYVVNTRGVIDYAFVDFDYKKRAETKDILRVLKKMKK